MGVEGQSLRKLREFCVLETSNSAFQRQLYDCKNMIVKILEVNRFGANYTVQTHI